MVKSFRPIVQRQAKGDSAPLSADAFGLPLNSLARIGLGVSHLKPCAVQLIHDEVAHFEFKEQIIGRDLSIVSDIIQ